MGSSAKKKKEKKKDFQKTKLRVGKTKAKPDNFTDTSFKAKSITINQQSLQVSAPAANAQFTHYLSLASSSKSDTQRKDALAYLCTTISSQPVNQLIPQPNSVILPKVLPLILDGSNPVRNHLLKLLRLLPSDDISSRCESILLYVRAGMTHLATAISMDALSVLEWLLEVAKDEVVKCPGGWVKTLKAFMTMMGWASMMEKSKWSSSLAGKSSKNLPRQLTVLGKFLEIGLGEEEKRPPLLLVTPESFPRCNWELYKLPTQSNAFAYLNLFGPPRDEEGEMYHDREARQRVFKKLFHKTVELGVEDAKKKSGEVGRASGSLNKALKEGMKDYEDIEEDDGLW